MRPRCPLVTVVMPVYNGERFVGEAIGSVFAQAYRPLELVVIDDGSTDRTPAILTSFGAQLRVVTQENAGQATARNAGVAVARGELLAFLDADDVMAPGRLETQVAYLDEHPDVDCVLGRQALVIEPGVAPPAWVARAGDHERADLVQPMSMLVRRAAFDAVGPFDTAFRLSEDADWLFRARDAGLGVTVLEDVVVHRRIHGGNLSYDTAGCQAEMFLALKGRADRKRARRS